MLKINDIVFLGDDINNSQFYESGYGHETHKAKIVEVEVETFLIRYKIEIVDSTAFETIGQMMTIAHGHYIAASNQLSVLFEPLTNTLESKCVEGEFLKHSKDLAFQENNDCVALSIFDQCRIIPKAFLTDDEIVYLRDNAETFKDFRFMEYWNNDELNEYLESINTDWR